MSFNFLDDVSRTIGTIERVSAQEIRVVLEVNAPHATALNAGTPTPFPRINSYLVVPFEAGYVVGLVAAVAIERSPFPRRTGLRDFGVIDLPFPMRHVVLSPVGTLARSDVGLEFARGIYAFPTVGDSVLLPTSDELRAIVESAEGERRLQIGISPLAGGARVFVNPDRLFGRHVAILGNTGGGKSCSIAGLIRWSLESAQSARNDAKRDGVPNARFIVLDPNGEYAHAFRDLKDRVRVFTVSPQNASEEPLKLPAWMWNSQEWSAFAAAAPGAQRPLLIRALRAIKSGRTAQSVGERNALQLLREDRMEVQAALIEGISRYQEFPGLNQFGGRLDNLVEDVNRYAGGTTDGKVEAALIELSSGVAVIANARRWTSGSKTGFNAFSETDVIRVRDLLDQAIAAFPESGAAELAGGEDAPIPFDVTELPDLLEGIARSSSSGQLSQFVTSLAVRIRGMLEDSRLRDVLHPEGDVELADWLRDYIGDDQAKNGQIVILDVSLVAADVLHLVVATVARLVLEASQRYRKLNQTALPTTIVLEEAHNFIQKPSNDSPSDPAAEACRLVFERIAREGRKFGVGLVLSSQRPSEVSETVLAQCNTFLLHRIVNDRDRSLVGRLVPDQLSGLLSDLPSLPSRQAILLGWAAPLPVLVEVRPLPREQQPQSSDPDIWAVWTGAEERPITWSRIVDDWRDALSPTSGADES